VIGCRRKDWRSKLFVEMLLELFIQFANGIEFYYFLKGKPLKCSLLQKSGGFAVLGKRFKDYVNYSDKVV